MGEIIYKYNVRLIRWFQPALRKQYPNWGSFFNSLISKLWFQFIISSTDKYIHQNQTTIIEFFEDFFAQLSIFSGVSPKKW